MTHYGALNSLPTANLTQLLAFTTGLTDKQLECLSRCARGISLRFEASEIVEALVAGGYAEEGVARVVTVTAAGRHFLRNHALTAV
jgi:hypothetical protein